MKTNLISDYSEVQDLVNKTKQIGHCLLTNFYPDDLKIKFWISQGLISCCENEGSFLILRKHFDFFYLFFLSTGIENLENTLKLLLTTSPNRFVIDFIVRGKEPGILPLLFERIGFKHHETLLRMVMKSSQRPKFEVSDDCNMFAKIDDTSLIFRFLTERLDPFSEQIPTLDEIKLMILGNQLLILKEGCEIGGILYFEKNGEISHLKEWLVDERFRGNYFGSLLIKQYFSLNNGCSRFILWVKKDNIHAIDIYKHYGYLPDNINDMIFVNL